MKDFEYYVSGRIEFLGKHTDYCGGNSIVSAIDKGFIVKVSLNKTNKFKLINEDTKEVVEFDLDGSLVNSDIIWSKYPQSVIERISKNFTSKKLVGCDLLFRSDLPQAAGLSSSSAFIVATFVAISKVNNFPEFSEYRQNINSSEDLANYLGCIENGQNFADLKGENGVGTFGGSQDQTAIICCKTDYLSQFSFCPVDRKADLFLPQDYIFVVAVCGVVAEKIGLAKDKFNRLSLLVKEIVNKFDEHLTLSQVIDKYGFEAVKAKLESKELIDRVTQFYVENFEIIPKVSKLLKEGKLAEIGELIDKSHRNADEFLGNQTIETNFLQRSAREIGATAASAFGAGFGGSVYALVKKNNAEKFINEWQNSYHKVFPQHQEKSIFFITKPSQSEI
jgi:galactokinase